MAITTGTKLSSDITAAATSAGVGQAPDRRRLYDFSDRVAELTPEETPFFTYLSNVSKEPTDDPVFRYLENRSKIDFSKRSLLLAADGVMSTGNSETVFHVELFPVILAVPNIAVDLTCSIPPELAVIHSGAVAPEFIASC